MTRRAEEGHHETPPPGPPGPRPSPFRRIRRFAAAVLARFAEDDGPVYAGHIAYSLMLATLPFLIFAVALAGFLVGEEGASAAVEILFRAVPEHVARTIEPVLREVLGSRRGGVLTLSALATLWAASNGVEAIRLGLDRAYGVPRARHMALSRLIALAVVLGGIAVFALLAVLIVFAPLAFALIERWTGVTIPATADLLRYGIGLALLWLSLWVAHRVLPSRRMRGMVLWPGVLASVMIWSLAATGLSLYLAFAPGFSLTYGALAGVMITLVFFYFTGLALMLGAEVNAEANGIERRRAPGRHRRGAGGPGATSGPDAGPGRSH